MLTNSQTAPVGFQSFLPRSLGTRMLLLMMALLILLVGATGFIGNQVITGILNEYIGRAALNVSKAVSLTSVVQTGLKHLEPENVQDYAEKVRKATGACITPSAMRLLLTQSAIHAPPCLCSRA